MISITKTIPLKKIKNLQMIQQKPQRMIDRSQNFCNFQFTSHPQITLQFNVVQMKGNLRNKNFENIKIQNTSLVGTNFPYMS
ncbi:unnamed protein product [Paramecium pentaurelia]|uniref:Uncharacterized protein n=1 Tax=Paramecium pentaurelia TaxID=43138 RepID=A0A8S1XLZ5_9CILI|nr:unnamed protein product [Paramecium pentaurelia]